MFCDVFDQNAAIQLLQKKKIWFIGSSNMRAIYKDMLWLLNIGDIASPISFKIKNEPSFLNDKRLSDDTLHNGRNYKETREFKSDKFHLFFHFITRLYLDHFLDLIKSITPETAPDVIFFNSGLWDLTRWGPDGPNNFKANILKTFQFLKNTLPTSTRLIWKTSLPVSLQASGAIFVDEIKFIVPMLPWHILEANHYASNCASFFNYDVIDLHHYMRLQGHMRVKDGIHWDPPALRYITNVFLTHLSLAWKRPLPGNFKAPLYYLPTTTKITLSENLIKERVEKKAGYFKKLFDKTENALKIKKFPGSQNKGLSMRRSNLKRSNSNNNRQAFKRRVQNNFNQNNFNQNNYNRNQATYNNQNQEIYNDQNDRYRNNKYHSAYSNHNQDSRPYHQCWRY